MTLVVDGTLLPSGMPFVVTTGVTRLLKFLGVELILFFPGVRLIIHPGVIKRPHIQHVEHTGPVLYARVLRFVCACSNFGFEKKK